MGFGLVGYPPVCVHGHGPCVVRYKVVGLGCKVVGNLWIWAEINCVQDLCRVDRPMCFLSRQLVSIKP